MPVIPTSPPEKIHFASSIFRQGPRDYGPFFQNLRGVPHQPSGRWNEQDVNLAQYWSLSPWGAWAEFIRYNEIRSRSVAKEAMRDVWTATPTCRAMADLSTFDRYEACGLDPWMAVEDDHTRCQELRRWLESNGYDGVISPSAALPGESNVTMFGERLLVRQTTRSHAAMATPLPDKFVAASQLGIDAAPPLDLVLETRHYGQPHLDFERWRLGNP